VNTLPKLVPAQANFASAFATTQIGLPLYEATPVTLSGPLDPNGTVLPQCKDRCVGARAEDPECAPPPPSGPRPPPNAIAETFSPTGTCRFPYAVRAKNPYIANGDPWSDENCWFAANTTLAYDTYPPMGCSNQLSSVPGLVVYDGANPAHRCRIHRGPQRYGCGSGVVASGQCPYAQDVYMRWYQRQP
jgi:hypothetical protein